MYKNTGSKIKDIVSLLTGLGISLCIVAGVVLFYYSILFDRFYLFLIGIGVAVIGSLFIWWSNILLAGFGELIEETTRSSNELQEIRNLLADMQVNSDQGVPVRQDPSDR